MLAVRWWNKSRRPEFVKQCVAQCMTCWWRARESPDTEGVRPLRIWSHKYLIWFPVILGPCVGYMAARKSVRWTRSSSTGLWRLWSDCRMRWRRIRGRKQRCTSLQVSSSIFRSIFKWLKKCKVVHEQEVATRVEIETRHGPNKSFVLHRYSYYSCFKQWWVIVSEFNSNGSGRRELDINSISSIQFM